MKYFDELDHSDLCRSAKIMRRAAREMGLLSPFDFSRWGSEYVYVEDPESRPYRNYLKVRFSDHPPRDDAEPAFEIVFSDSGMHGDGDVYDAIAAVSRKFGREAPAWAVAAKPVAFIADAMHGPYCAHGEWHE